MFTVWICLFVLLLGLEIATINLVSIWFALGSLTAAFVSLLTENIFIQIASFALMSILVLLIMRPLVKRFTKAVFIPVDLDEVVGKIGLITQDVSSRKVGEAFVDGKRWPATSKKKIVKDKEVKVLEILDDKLLVEEKESE